MSDHVLLNLNELGKDNKYARLCRAFNHVCLCNELNKFNNTGARMFDSIYHRTLKLN